MTMLNFQRLMDGEHPGIPRHAGRLMAHSVGVCLEDQNHVPPVLCALQGSQQGECVIAPPEITDQDRRFAEDKDDTTEWAAYGVAIELTAAQTGLMVTLRSRRGNGFDFWMGREQPAGLFGALGSSELELEVSGIRNGDQGDVKDRVKEKSARLQRYATSRHRRIAVVEFGRPLVHLQDDEP